MKRFLIKILLFVCIPILVLVAVYLITDPFKTLHPFSFQCFDDTNRDYFSSELFLRNNPVYHYNSFIFGSSRCCGFNTFFMCISIYTRFRNITCAYPLIYIFFCLSLTFLAFFTFITSITFSSSKRFFFFIFRHFAFIFFS